MLLVFVLTEKFAVGSRSHQSPGELDVMLWLHFSYISVVQVALWRGLLSKQLPRSGFCPSSSMANYGTKVSSFPLDLTSAFQKSVARRCSILIQICRNTAWCVKAGGSVGNQTYTLYSPCTSLGRELCLLVCAGFCAGFFFGALHPAGPQLHPVVPGVVSATLHLRLLTLNKGKHWYLFHQCWED